MNPAPRFAFLAFSVMLSCLSLLARDVPVVAGTLLQCTLNEPRLSSQTAQPGDPVLAAPGLAYVAVITASPQGSSTVANSEVKVWIVHTNIRADIVHSVDGRKILEATLLSHDGGQNVIRVDFNKHEYSPLNAAAPALKVPTAPRLTAGSASNHGTVQVNEISPPLFGLPVRHYRLHGTISLGDKQHPPSKADVQDDLWATPDLAAPEFEAVTGRGDPPFLSLFRSSSR